MQATSPYATRIDPPDPTALMPRRSVFASRWKNFGLTRRSAFGSASTSFTGRNVPVNSVPPNVQEPQSREDPDDARCRRPDPIGHCRGALNKDTHYLHPSAPSRDQQ